MPRWETVAAARPRAASPHLFTEHDAPRPPSTTSPRRSGSPSAPSFRLFADKEEVLFDPGATMLSVLRAGLAEAIPAAPAGAVSWARGDAPVAARHAVPRVAASFEADRTAHRMRADVLAQVPSLQARPLLKQQAWVDDLVEALVAAGVPPRAAVALAGAACSSPTGAGSPTARVRRSPHSWTPSSTTSPWPPVCPRAEPARVCTGGAPTGHGDYRSACGCLVDEGTTGLRASLGPSITRLPSRVT